ncbi:MAG: CubicO group peptidase (beta-lactamase class C family) [Saprospiraceae bacterium]|jgi:CubicO group peptidase (beta-lactamase class C family)
MMQQITGNQTQIISQTLKRFPDGTELAIALVNSEQTKYHGVRLTNNSIKTIANKDSYFEIGSITKLFTATILVNVLAKHGISLDDEINPFLDVSVNNGEKLTFKSLANHTSGLPPEPESIEFDEKSENPFVYFKKQDFLNYLQNELTVNEDKIGKWSYSNIGMAILGYVLGLIEKKSFRELVDFYVFSVYNMPTSTYNRNSINGVIIGGQNSKGEPVLPWGFAEMDDPTGGVLANVQELSRFVLENFKNDEYLRYTRQKTYSGEDYFDWAIGWGILKSNGYHLHSGGTRGHSSILMIDEKKSNGIVILSNVSCYHEETMLIRDMGIQLLDSI